MTRRGWRADASPKSEPQPLPPPPSPLRLMSNREGGRRELQAPLGGITGYKKRGPRLSSLPLIIFIILSFVVWSISSSCGINRIEPFVRLDWARPLALHLPSGNSGLYPLVPELPSTGPSHLSRCVHPSPSCSPACWARPWPNRPMRARQSIRRFRRRRRRRR